MIPTWLNWIYEHMPPDLLDQYLTENKASQAYVARRIKELEGAIENIAESCREVSS